MLAVLFSINSLKLRKYEYSRTHLFDPGDFIDFFLYTVYELLLLVRISFHFPVETLNCQERLSGNAHFFGKLLFIFHSCFAANNYIIYSKKFS